PMISPAGVQAAPVRHGQEVASGIAKRPGKKIIATSGRYSSVLFKQGDLFGLPENKSPARKRSHGLNGQRPISKIQDTSSNPTLAKPINMDRLRGVNVSIFLPTLAAREG